MTSEEIRNYCEEALTISKQQGTRDGLTFLIGEKLMTPDQITQAQKLAREWTEKHNA